MRFHVTALPHTNTTKEYLSCAYTAKVMNFCRMMKDREHEVFLYGGEQNEALCTEHIVCVSETDRAAHVGGQHFTSASFDYELPFWQNANRKIAEEIAKRSEQKDFICVIGGWSQKAISDYLPNLMCVEFGVGYGGTFTKKRVFESYAWMHTVYGSETMGRPQDADGNWWDAVIPGYLDPALFPFSNTKDDYFLYIGRLIDRKGYNIAVEVCHDLGKRLVVCGPGVAPPGVDFRGIVGPEERGKLMSRAQAVFVPTIYIEPFGNVNVEAQACGTPVITTDWGAFTETVEHGKTGFRCRNYSQFREAAVNAFMLDRNYIVERARELYSLESVGLKYEQYFERLLTLWEEGWYVGKNEIQKAA